jgi:hypothetical protein
MSDISPPGGCVPIIYRMSDTLPGVDKVIKRCSIMLFLALVARLVNEARVFTAYKPGSDVLPGEEVSGHLDPTKPTKIVRLNNLWECKVNLVHSQYKLYLNMHVTNGTNQFVQILLREKNTLESNNNEAISCWMII